MGFLHTVLILYPGKAEENVIIVIKTCDEKL